MQRRSSYHLPLIAALLLACSDDLPPAAFAPEPCVAQPVYEAAALSNLDEQDVRAAVLDAAERITPGIGDDERATDLGAALLSLEAGGEHAMDAACRAIRLARDLLNAQPDVPETRPDRTAILLVLDLAETYYAGAR